MNNNKQPRDINTVIVTGTLTENCDITGQNANIASFTVKNTKRGKLQDGTWGEVDNFVPFEVWLGPRTEELSAKLHKGAHVMITGSLTSRETNGKSYLKLSCWPDDIRFLYDGSSRNAFDELAGMMPDGSEQTQKTTAQRPSSYQAAKTTPPQAPSPTGAEFDDKDIDF